MTQNLKPVKDKTRIDKKESDRHYRGKMRLCQIFRDRGFKAEVEQRFPCFVELGGFTVKYRADVFATTKGDTKGVIKVRCILAEVDGYKGHKSTLAKALQSLRLRRIRETYGETIEEYRFTLSRLSKWTDQEIAEEMRL